jgi:hypothetical protein
MPAADPNLLRQSAPQNNAEPDLHEYEAHEHDAHQQHSHAVYASETTGLLLIAALLLVLTLFRYWHYIHWSLR